MIQSGVALLYYVGLILSVLQSSWVHFEVVRLREDLIAETFPFL
jgi:hypothetical protein